MNGSEKNHNEIYARLAELAKKSCENSYSPYSNFKVGCAVLCGENVYTGCNVENVSYGATNCAERTAIFTAVANGERNLDVIAIAAKNSEGNFTDVTPCGICRQVISEFADENTKVVLVCGNGELKICNFGELLPCKFEF